MALESGGKRIETQDESDKIISDLLAAADGDEGFKQFMGVEFRDLDRGIKPLVYALWKDPVVKTNFSCAGHADRFLMDAGNATMPDHFVYSPGFLFFEDIDPARTDAFFELLTKSLEPYPFARIKRSEDARGIQKHSVMLFMNDIATETNTPDRSPYRLNSTKEIPATLAKERLAVFQQIWKKLAIESVKLKNL